ncbi:MAG: long-chain fatty acid--CoA ligase [Desulfobacterales bacterium]|nr:long-chain fatty acid--CoA ligase [Desulfobacterales bacterium]
MTVDTLPKALCAMTAKQPERIALSYKDLGIWHTVTWREHEEKVKYVALGLHKLGLKRGDHTSIIGENKPEWLYSTMGNMSAGGVSVGVYTTSPASECEYVVGHSDSLFYICEDEEQLDKALIFRGNTPELQKIIVWDMKDLRHFQDPMVMSFEELLTLGKEVHQRNPELFDELVSQGKKDDTAAIVYTSGTTGPPKGAMLSHGGYLWMGEQMMKTTRVTKDDETISFLPLNHVFEQIFDLMMHLTVGHIISFTENTDTLTRDLKEVSPTIFHAVPRIWEKFHSSIVLRMDDATWLKRTVFNIAKNIGARYNELKLSKRDIPMWLNISYFLAYFCVFRKLKERLGLERLRLGFSGAAPISHDILRFFQGIGVPIREGYGMTEMTGVTHASDETNFKLGTVGRALPGTQCKIAEDGEILVRHDAMFQGYFKDDHATREAIVDEWMHTGDVGEIDEDGYLKITDRKKDLIITAGGKNIAPQYIENLLKTSPYINDAIVIGDNRKYLTAIIVIDEENVVKFAQNNKVQFTTFASLTRTKEATDLIQKEINKVNKNMARVENIRKFRILDKKLYTEDGEVTPTMKVKRAFINKAYADMIESMYR